MGAALKGSVKVFEVDMADVVRSKVAMIRQSSRLSNMLSLGADEEHTSADDSLLTPEYCLFACDLRQCSAFAEALRSHGFETSYGAVLEGRGKSLTDAVFRRCSSRSAC